MAGSPSSAAGGFLQSRLSFRKSEEIADLIDLFSKTQYRAKEITSRVEAIETRCLELFARDYKFSVIQNSNGEVCGHYPRQIVFLEYECTDVENDRYESTLQISKLQDLVNRSKMARCRGRFVCPVILYDGKHICRSSTLAGWGELYGRTGYNYIFSGGSDDTWTESEEVPEDDSAVRNGDSQLFDKVRGHDIKLLRYLSVRYICDLMVENKKVKFGLNVTSSEKADKAQRYADFTLLSVPYPGCEFFKDYKDRDYTAEGLVFNWNQDYVDAPLTIPMCFTQNLNIDWTQYQSWDLVEQTQNYLKLLLHIINNDDESGLLVHCISGWDRTPLFVSLLRLSLWADGAVHVNLEPGEILYLTISHNITTTDALFSFLLRRKGTTSSPQMVVWNKQNPLDECLPHPLNEARSSSSSSSNQSEHAGTRTGSSPLAVPGRSCPFPSERQARLEAVREIFLAAYSSTVGLKSSAPSPSGAISGLLEQFARGVGLRGTNTIV
uniref:Tyrosine specific protein phosphatases domain-containing protein n=1 Tax=Echeneis naucrates TaxID=173247 RepID=A0A665W468_ECHNA